MGGVFYTGVPLGVSGTSQDLLGILPLGQSHTYSFMTLGSHLFSIIPSYIDSLPTRLTISPISLSLVMTSDDQKSFESFIHLAPLVVVQLRRMRISFYLTVKRSSITSSLLRLMESHMLLIN